MTTPTKVLSNGIQISPEVMKILTGMYATPEYEVISVESLALLIIIVGVVATFAFNTVFKKSGNNLPRVSMIGTVVEMLTGLPISIGGILYDLFPENPWPDRFVNVPYKIHAGLLVAGIIIWAGAVIYQQLVIKRLFGIMMEDPGHESHHYFDTFAFEGHTYAVIVLSSISAILSFTAGIMGIFELAENVELYFRAFIGASILPLIFALIVRMTTLHMMLMEIDKLKLADTVGNV